MHYVLFYCIALAKRGLTVAPCSHEGQEADWQRHIRVCPTMAYQHRIRRNSEKKVLCQRTSHLETELASGAMVCSLQDYWDFLEGEVASPKTEIFQACGLVPRTKGQLPPGAVAAHAQGSSY